MIKLLAFALLVAVATASPFLFDPELAVHWEKFKTEYGKSYEIPQEDNYR